MRGVPFPHPLTPSSRVAQGCKVLWLHGTLHIRRRADQEARPPPSATESHFYNLLPPDVLCCSRACRRTPWTSAL